MKSKIYLNLLALPLAAGLLGCGIEGPPAAPRSQPLVEGQDSTQALGDIRDQSSQLPPGRSLALTVDRAQGGSAEARPGVQQAGAEKHEASGGSKSAKRIDEAPVAGRPDRQPGS